MSPRKRTATPKPVDFHDRLPKALSKVDWSGDSCSCGDRPLVMPGLEVDGMGVLGRPLTKTHARKLIKLCRQAPYGKETETVVDTDVRRVWEEAGLNPILVALAQNKAVRHCCFTQPPKSI